MPTSNLTIRPYAAGDFDAILALNEAEVPHVGSVSADRMQAVLDWSAVALVAEVDNEFAGFVIALGPASTYDSVNYRWFDERYEDFLYIDRIAIGGNGRRLGLATRLYDAALAARPAPVLLAEVNVVPANPVSMSFHARYGFEEVGRLGDAQKSVAMLAATQA